MHCCGHVLIDCQHFSLAAKVTFQNGFARTAAGSIIAGVVAGYLSHIPHNVSTLKLLEVRRGYGDNLSVNGQLLFSYGGGA